MELTEKYSFKINKDNFNCLLVYEKGKEDGRFHTAIALPPILCGIDLINFGAEVKPGIFA